MLGPLEVAGDVDSEQLECSDSLDHSPVKCQLRRVVFHDEADQHLLCLPLEGLLWCSSVVERRTLSGELHLQLMGNRLYG